MAISLAALQRALDLYGTAQYWLLTPGSTMITAELINSLRNEAIAQGVSQAQLTDAEQYARQLVNTNRKPLLARDSAQAFVEELKSD